MKKYCTERIRSILSLQLHNILWDLALKYAEPKDSIQFFELKENKKDELNIQEIVHIHRNLKLKNTINICVTAPVNAGIIIICEQGRLLMLSEQEFLLHYLGTFEKQEDSNPSSP